MHYDTAENKFDFESKNPDNPFDEEEDDGKLFVWWLKLHNQTLFEIWCIFVLTSCGYLLLLSEDDDDDDDDDDDEEEEDEDDDE